MKNKKTIKNLFLILLFLTGVVVVKNYWPKLRTEKSKYEEVIKQVKPDEIETIEISQKEEVIKIEKKDGRWQIKGKKADEEKVEELINSFWQTKKPQVIALTDKNHKQLELTEELAKKINLGNKLKLLIGKQEGGECYLRFLEEPTVYLLKDIPYVSLKTADWYDKKILKINQEKIKKIVSVLNRETKVIVKKEEDWFEEKRNQKIEKEKVESFLSEVTNLIAQSVYEEEKNNYNKESEFILTIEYDDNQEKLDFYKGKVDYLVKRNSDGEKFIISEYTASSLKNKLKEI